ncbi:MAG: helix-turn-helix transcriptional regulator [Sphingomonas sp.]
MDITALYRTVGQRIVLRRNELSMTQAELGTRIALSRAAVANIERGHQKLSLHQVYLLAEALGLALSDLLPVAVDGGQTAGSVEISGADDLSDAARRQIEQLYLGTGAGS